MDLKAGTTISQGNLDSNTNVLVLYTFLKFLFQFVSMIQYPLATKYLFILSWINYLLTLIFTTVLGNSVNWIYMKLKKSMLSVPD